MGITVSLDTAIRIAKAGWNDATVFGYFPDGSLGDYTDDSIPAPTFEEIWAKMPDDLGADDTGYAEVKMLIGDCVSYGDNPPEFSGKELGGLANAAAEAWLLLQERDYPEPLTPNPKF